MKYIIRKLWAPVLLLIIAAAVLIRGCRDGILKQFFHAYVSFAAYVISVGIVSGFLGNLLPRTFDTKRGLFSCRPFEQEGRFYEKRLRIKRWKNRMFDLSRAVSGMEKKQLRSHMELKDRTERLVQETCVAEVTHLGLVILSPLMFLLCRNHFMAVLWFLYVISNLLDIIIQRYNRPRLLKIINRRYTSNESNCTEL